MKKYLLTLLALFVLLAPNVKADDTKLGVQGDKYVISSINSTSGYDDCDYECIDINSLYNI